MRNHLFRRWRLVLGAAVAALVLVGASCEDPLKKHPIKPDLPGNLSIDPTSKNFLSVPLDDTGTEEQAFVVTNHGPGATGALDVSLDPTTDFVLFPTSDECDGAILGDGDTCVVAVRFAPTGAGGSKAADLIVDDPDNGEAVATLSGMVLES
jgi:hypothetical protein